MAKNWYSKELRESVDSDGVITKSETTTRMKGGNEPPYVKMYCDDIGFYGGLSPMESKVLFALAMSCNYENEVRGTKHDRQIIADFLNEGREDGQKTSAESVRFCIGGLIKAGFLAKKATGLYILNPDYFSRKSWVRTRETKATFEMHVRYSPESGREMKIIHQE